MPIQAVQVSFPPPTNTARVWCDAGFLQADVLVETGSTEDADHLFTHVLAIDPSHHDAKIAQAIRSAGAFFHAAGDGNESSRYMGYAAALACLRLGFRPDERGRLTTGEPAALITR